VTAQPTLPLGSWQSLCTGGDWVTPDRRKHLEGIGKIVKNEFEKHVIGTSPETVDQVTESREEFSRRNILGSTLATAALAGLTAYGQETQNTRKAERDKSVSNPAQENKALLAENPNSNMGSGSIWT